MSKVVVVDKNDKVIGYKVRDDKNDIYITRVTGLWIVNSKKEALIAQRSLDKVHSSGKWGPTVAGTVEERETYLINIIKETDEEIGLNISENDLSLGPHRYVETSHKYFLQIYFIQKDIPLSEFTIDKDELNEIRWVPIAELVEWFNNKPDDFIASFGDVVKDLENYKF